VPAREEEEEEVLNSFMMRFKCRREAQEGSERVRLKRVRSKGLSDGWKRSTQAKRRRSKAERASQYTLLALRGASGSGQGEGSRRSPTRDGGVGARSSTSASRRCCWPSAYPREALTAARSRMALLLGETNLNYLLQIGRQSTQELDEKEDKGGWPARGSLLRDRRTGRVRAAP
jgi:hypothetical protein